MLPAVTLKTATIKRAAVATLTALAIAFTPAAPALAWGQREQDVLTGVVGTLIVGGIINEVQRPHREQPVYRQPEPVYQPHRPVYVEPRYEREPRHRKHHYEQPRPTVSIYNTAAGRAFNSYSSSERRMIQRRLAAFGYYRGGADGSFGPGTYNAIVAYAQDQGQARQLGSTATAYAVYDGLIY
jgi:hypothetical protein